MCFIADSDRTDACCHGWLQYMKACTVMLAVDQSATVGDILRGAVFKLAALDRVVRTALRLVMLG